MKRPTRKRRGGLGWHHAGVDRSVRTLALLIVVATTACVSVRTTRHTSDRTLSTRHETRPAGQTRHRVRARLDTDTLRLHATTYEPCLRITWREVERTTRLERSIDPDDVGRHKWMWGIGVLGAAVLGGSIFGLARDMDEHRLAWLGVAVGGLFTAELVAAIAGSVRAVDSTTRVRANVHERRESRCDERDAGARRLTLTGAAGAPLLSVDLDSRGRAAVPVGDLADRIVELGGVYHVRLDGDDAGSTDALEARFRELRDARQAERRRQARAEEESRIRAVAAEETRDGRCLPERSQQVQGVLLRLGQIFESMGTTGSSFELWLVEDHEIFAIHPGGSARAFTPSLGGEYHLFALGYEPLDLRVRDGAGNLFDQPRSPYEAIVANFAPHADSVTLRLNGRDRVTAEIDGLGCALFLAVQRR